MGGFSYMPLRSAHVITMLCGRQRVMFFLVDHFACISQRSTYVRFADFVLARDLLDAHASSQAANNSYDRYASTANDRLPHAEWQGR